MGHEARVGDVGHIAATDELLDVHLAGALDAAFPLEVVLARGRVHRFYVVVADSGVVSTCECDTYHVGADARDVAAAGDSVAQPAGVLVDQQLACHPVVVVFGIGERPQRGKVPVAAPDCVGVVVVVDGLAVRAERNLAHGAVVAGIGAADVAGEAASEQGVVQAGVEFDLVAVLAAIGRDAAQGFLPCVMCLTACLVEGQGARLGLEVGLCIFDGSI